MRLEADYSSRILLVNGSRAVLTSHWRSVHMILYQSMVVFPPTQGDSFRIALSAHGA